MAKDPSSTSNPNMSPQSTLGRAPTPGKGQFSVDEATRNHWLNLAEKQGIDTTLTQIHNEIGKLEPRVFGGGFDQDRFDRVQNLRFLSRELWNLKLRQATEKTYGAEAAEKTFGNIAKRTR